MKLFLAAFIAAIAMSACSSKPKHYYVLCEGQDPRGWNLVGTESDQGYLIACTYQSPDKVQSYTVRCNNDGCD
jgi:hypothetical protein